MAFLCPLRIPHRRRKRRQKDGKSTAQNGTPGGQTTDSNSADSLVGNGKGGDEDEIEFEPRKMVVLHDFIPCVEDEVAVKRGEHVKALYQETDWIYIINSNGKEGFIPFTYCLAEDEYEKRKERQKAAGLHRRNFRNTSFLDSMELQVQTDTQPVASFSKRNFGDFLVRFDFDATDEGDISARKGDVITVLNKDDADWYWVSKKNGHEGFIPKDFIVRADQVSLHRSLNGEPSSRSSPSGSSQSSPRSPLIISSATSSSRADHVAAAATPNATAYQNATPTSGTMGLNFQARRNSNELLLYGQELVCIDTHKAKRADELTVLKGDWIYADMKHKDARGWIWAYSPSLKNQGFVPKSCLRPPATTPL